MKDPDGGLTEPMNDAEGGLDEGEVVGEECCTLNLGSIRGKGSTGDGAIYRTSILIT